MKDLIDRADALMYLNSIRYVVFMCGSQHDALQVIKKAIKCIQDLPSAEPEPLTDEEQSIFLSAMEREEKVCKQYDEELGEPNEDILVRICHMY